MTIFTTSWELLFFELSIHTNRRNGWRKRPMIISKESVWTNYKIFSGLQVPGR
jgi:hypothetical protein